MNGLTPLARSRAVALTVAFDRAALVSAARVGEQRVVTVERRTIAKRFRGRRAAYLRALAARGTTVAGARAAISDELRVRALGAAAASGRVTKLLATAICRGDVLPSAALARPARLLPFLVFG